MNDLIVRGKQDFMGREIPVLIGGFGERIKCICDKTIAQIHRMKESDVRNLITDNIKSFEENIDFIDLKQHVSDGRILEVLQRLGYVEQSVADAEHIYLLSECGYSTLIRIIGTHFAWEVHDLIMDEYFQSVTILV